MTTKTRERPIIFTGDEVRAVLDGRKTQTRRVVKPQPSHGEALLLDDLYGTNITDSHGGIRYGPRCPFGVPGDRLWVRETWNGCQLHGGGSLVSYRASADEPVTDDGRWRPSIHMPRWASRIDLEVTNVRVERLQEITLDDIYAEGVRHPEYWPGTIGSDFSVRNVMFPKGWDALYGKRGHGWDTNCWVWIIEFRRVER